MKAKAFLTICVSVLVTVAAFNFPVNATSSKKSIGSRENPTDAKTTKAPSGKDASQALETHNVERVTGKRSAEALRDYC